MTEATEATEGSNHHARDQQRTRQVRLHAHRRRWHRRLALAAFFARDGRACELIERAPAFAPVGAGITLGVNAMRVMQALGVEQELCERGQVLDELAITDASGRRLARTDLAGLRARFGPSVALHRAVLHDVLARLAASVPTRLGTVLESLDAQSSTPRGLFSDTTEQQYAAVIGADGLHSRTREQLFGQVPIAYAGYTCWRLIVQRPPELQCAVEMWGRGLRFGIVPIDAERIYCFAVANAPRDTPDPEDGRLARFRARFAEFGGAVPAILEQLQHPDQLIHNDLCEVVHQPWHRGSVVLLGDAAHAMTPNMGQGASMALEDAQVLADLARQAASTDTPLPSVFERLTQRRKARVRWVQDQSRRIGRVAQWHGGVACAARNALLRALPDRMGEAGLVRLAESRV